MLEGGSPGGGLPPPGTAAVSKHETVIPVGTLKFDRSKVSNFVSANTSRFFVPWEAGGPSPNQHASATPPRIWNIPTYGANIATGLSGTTKLTCQKYLRAKRANTYCDPILTAAQIPDKCLRAKRTPTHCDPTLTAAQIRHKWKRAKRATTPCDPSLTAAQIPHEYLRAKRVTTHCDPTLTVAQIPHQCLRAKRAKTYCDSTLTAAQISVKCL